MSATEQRLWSPSELAVAYAGHVVLKVVTMGGLRHLMCADGEMRTIPLEHDARISKSIGVVIHAGIAAAEEFWAVGRKALGSEVLFEPNSDTVVVPPRWCTTGELLVVVNAKDVLAVLERAAD